MSGSSEDERIKILEDWFDVICIVAKVLDMPQGIRSVARL